MEGKESKWFNPKGNLDEMQEQKLLKIEHNGLWMFFWGLAISIVIQAFIYEKTEWKYVAGEFIIFMAVCLYMGLDAMRNGIWDRKIAPTVKANLIMSAIVGIMVGIFETAISYKRYHEPDSSIWVGILHMFAAAIATFFLQSILLFVYKKKHEKLENGEEDKE